ncbi:MAG: hypothetical protein L0Z49_03700 [Actinobacteria bacterium]|nr:hypothetical protein [Actinomycetota bacterium]
MRARTKRWMVLAAIGALMLAPAPSSAQTEDTVFNFGYDEENQVFVWGQSSVDGVLDCSMTLDGVVEAEFSGSFPATYGLTDDGLVVVQGLTHQVSGEPVSFPTEDGSEVYDPEGECGLAGGMVAGPQGQVNHGTFMRLFNALYDGGPGRGCLARHIAQSDLGKGDQQVLVSDVDPDAEPLTDGDTGTLDISSALTACERPNDDEDGDGPGRGRPDWAGQPGGPHAGD